MAALRYCRDSAFSVRACPPGPVNGASPRVSTCRCLRTSSADVRQQHGLAHSNVLTIAAQLLRAIRMTCGTAHKRTHVCACMQGSSGGDMWGQKRLRRGPPGMIEPQLPQVISQAVPH